MTITINDYFLLPPDWNAPLNHRRKWKTSIQTTIEESEKRSALFTWPRRQLRFDVQCMTPAESNYVRRKLYKNLRNVWGVPIWTERSELTAIASAGTATFSVDNTLLRNYDVGGKCIIWQNYYTYEAGTILSKTSNSITLTANLSGTWPVGTSVYPILKCRLDMNQTGRMDVDGYDQYQFEFFEVPDVSLTHYTFPFPLLEANRYESKDVFPLAFNWNTSIELDFKQTYETMEYLGPIYMDYSSKETNLILSGKFLAYNRTELASLLGIFDFFKGRWGAFWMSTHNQDIQITTGFLSSATTFVINSIEWTSYWSANDIIGKHLCFSFSDGTFAYRKITSAPSNTQIQINSSIGKAVTTAELKTLKVSFLLLCRFDFDELDIVQITENHSEANLKFTSIYTGNGGINSITPFPPS